MACFVDRDLIIEGVWDSQPENQSLPETEQHQAVLARETEEDQVSPVGGADSLAQGKKITRKRSVWSKTICILDHIFLFPTILIYKNCAVLFKIKTKALCFLGRWWREEIWPNWLW